MLKGLAIAGAAVVLLAVAAAGAFVAFGGLDYLRNQQAIVVPEQLRPVIIEAAERCPVVPAKVLAAQLASESSWDPRAVSPAGATGLAQFMPEVWEQYAVDGDNDGDRDIYDPVDAIHSAADNRLRNILAAYNAGFNQVVRYEGVPPFPETEQYVERVLTRAERIELN
jgi:soluble lytic murein transglycosylase-like protein